MLCNEIIAVCYENRMKQVRTYVHTHIHINTIYAHAYVYVYVYMCIYIHTYIHTCIHIYIYIYTYMHVYTYVYIYIYTYMYTYIHVCVYVCMYTFMCIYRVSQEEWTKLRESVSYVKIYRYNPKHPYPKLNGYGDNGQRSLKLWQLLIWNHSHCVYNKIKRRVSNTILPIVNLFVFGFYRCSIHFNKIKISFYQQIHLLLNI
jgi:hypothetical protein